MIKLANIEHCLELLAGLVTGPNFELVKEDHTIIKSIARQSFRGTPLTDRQFALMQTKLETYKSQFDNNGFIDFDQAITELRQPLRQIDRSKYIKIVSTGDVVGHDKVYESYKSELNWIKIRFPFSKKLIVDIQSISCPHTEHLHSKGSHEHYFLLNEKNAYRIVSIFENKNFDIDNTLLEYYKKIKQFDDREKFDSCLINYNLLNLHPKAFELAVSELGKPDNENIIKFKDRAKLYGINYFDQKLDETLSKASVLTQKIVARTSPTVFVDSTEWTFDNLISTLNDLDRYPLVVLIGEDTAYDSLSATHRCFRNIFDSSQISVNMRLPTKTSNGFNEYIKEYGLNSPVDKNTKIVYTNIDKLNKPLLESECNPRAILLLESRRVQMKVTSWLEQFDLVIHYDKEMSQFTRYAYRGFGNI